MKTISSTLFISCVVLVALLLNSCGKKKLKPLNSKATKEVGAPSLQVFLENSGSMDGFMVPGSELKDAVYDLVTRMGEECGRPRLFYLNSSTIAMGHDVRRFVRDMTADGFRAAGGNRSSSDVAEEIARVMKSTPRSTVSVFVSDCILALPSGNTSGWLVNRQIDLRQAVRDKLRQQPDFSVVVLHGTSRFSGRHYQPGQSSPVCDIANRPYYIWIMGPRDAMVKALRRVNLDDKRYGLLHRSAFVPEDLLPFDAANKLGTGHGLTEEKDGSVKVNLLVDMRSTFQSSSVLEDVSLYRSLSPEMTIERVTPVKDPQSLYTHVISLRLNDAKRGKEALSVDLNQPGMGAWVNEVNQEQPSLLTKTFGIKYLIQGVADAYEGRLARLSFKID